MSISEWQKEQIINNLSHILEPPFWANLLPVRVVWLTFASATHYIQLSVKEYTRHCHCHCVTHKYIFQGATFIKSGNARVLKPWKQPLTNGRWESVANILFRVSGSSEIRVAWSSGSPKEHKFQLLRVFTRLTVQPMICFYFSHFTSPSFTIIFIGIIAWNKSF